MLENIILLVLLGFMILMTATALVAFFVRVPFVPSSGSALEALREIDWRQAKKVCDLGSGNGKILFFLKQHYPHLELTGYEIAPIPYLWAVLKNKLLGTNIRFYFRNFFKEDLSQYDLFFSYLMPEVMQKVAVKIGGYGQQKLLVTNTFSLSDVPRKQEVKNKKGNTQLIVYELG